MTKKVLMLCPLAALALASCSSESNSPEANNNRNEARFFASINSLNSRAYNTVWEAGDQIGITGTSGAKAYANVAYSTDGTGNFTVVTPGTEIYYQTNDPVTFTAYYPYENMLNSSVILADTHEQADQKQFDYLWSQAQGSKANPNVAFNFAHKMSKVVLVIKRGSDVSFDEVKEAKVAFGGFINEGQFDPATGVATATGDASALYTFAGNADAVLNAPLTVDDAAETVSYSMIHFPQAFSAALPIVATLDGRQDFKAALDFTAGNSAAGDATAANEWVAGRQYTITVTLHKTALTVNGCTITPWTEVNSGDVDAE